MWRDLKKGAEAAFRDGEFADAAFGYLAALEALLRADVVPETKLEAAKLLANASAAQQRLSDWELAIKTATQATELAPDWEKGEGLAAPNWMPRRRRAAAARLRFAACASPPCP